MKHALVMLLIFFINYSFSQQLLIESTENDELVDTVCIISTISYPEFPGGDNGLRKFVLRNLKYPRSAVKDSVQGKVYVSFTINNDGRALNAKIIKGIREDVDKAAIELITKMPKWKIKNASNYVPVRYFLPIFFNP